MEHPYFGTIKVTNGIDWNGTVQTNDHVVSLVMTSQEAPSAAQLDAAADFARDIARFDALARAALAADVADDGPVTLYIEHHLSTLSPEALDSAFGTKKPAEISRTRFLGGMFLHRVGLYPESRAALAVFDFTLSGGVTDYVLCVSFDADGAVTSVDMES
jgi:hypothetical protein